MTQTALEAQQKPQAIECGRCGKTVFTFTMEEFRRDPGACRLKMRSAVDQHDADAHPTKRCPDCGSFPLQRKRGYCDWCDQHGSYRT